MRKNIYLLSAALILVGASVISCNSKGDDKNQANDQVETVLDTNSSKGPLKYSFINPFDNYFAINKVTTQTELSLDSIQFNKEFQFAATMNNKPVTINFQREKVGAIILPETEYETEIALDTNFVQNDTLHVVYSINKAEEKRTFTTVPVKLFSYSSKFQLLFQKKK